MTQRSHPEALAQPVRLQAKSAAARTLAAEHFSIEKMASDYEQLYASLR